MSFGYKGHLGVYVESKLIRKKKLNKMTKQTHFLNFLCKIVYCGKCIIYIV